VHGEEDAKSGFKEKLLKEGFAKVEIPEKGTIYNLD
jgi:hypothetical protein